MASFRLFGTRWFWLDCRNCGSFYGDNNIIPGAQSGISGLRRKGWHPLGKGDEFSGTRFNGSPRTSAIVHRGHIATVNADLHNPEFTTVVIPHAIFEDESKRHFSDKLVVDRTSQVTNVLALSVKECMLTKEIGRAHV